MSDPLTGFDPAFWTGRRVLLTGHTGFKGAWAALWLSRLGAEVTGIALPADETSLFRLAGIEADCRSIEADLRDPAKAAEAVARARPQIVLHMAAEAIVRRAWREPAATYATNVMGTVHLLDALDHAPDLEAVLVVTSDKVYANRNEGRPFTEDDPLGGDDPYSASKAAQEAVAAGYGKGTFEPRGVRLATARAGNVVGGGDFSEDRLVPDIARAARAAERLILRYPEATRPWQHVVDALAGYLAYATALATERAVPRSLNFGPRPGASATVAALANAVQEALGVPPGFDLDRKAGPVEKTALSLDSSRAREVLGWRDRIGPAELVDWTAEWYRAWADGADLRAATLDQLARYEAMS